MLLACGAMIDHRMIAGPSVIANPVPQAPVQTQDQETQTNEMEVFQPAGEAAQNSLPQIFQYGPVQLHPHLDYRVMYGNGIQSAPGNQQKTVIQEVSPGFTIDLGPHWVLDYTPTIRFYSSHELQDGVDHSVTLSGAVDYDAWKFGLSHSTLITSAPTVETGGQTDQSIHSTSLTASRPLSSSMSTDLSINQNITLVSGLQDSYDWDTLDWLNYQFWPRLNGGIGAGGGYVLIENNGPAALGGNSGNDNQTYEQLQARVNWRATDKLSFQLNGGLEDRQFESAGAGNSLNPLYGATIQYRAFQYTQISLSVNRTVGSSDYYLAAQQSEDTVVSVNLSQRLLKKFNLGLGASYSKTDYDTGAAGAAASAVNRSDDLYSLNATLSHPFYKRGTWSVFYQYTHDNSSQQGFGYQSSQVGFEVSYRY
ncbi:MAG TPA: outer membrane beta-barrel protein [Verrucomicrobiae bacterium]|nr:outer membrane beta-barrel protein [Verrucomicrobiae bacterium]